METIAIIQLATSGEVPSPGPLSRIVAALLAGRLNRAPSLQASLVELRASDRVMADRFEPVHPSESDVHDRVVVNAYFETDELEEIARTFQARNWLTGRLSIDPDENEVHIELEMAPVLAGSDGHAALVPWRRAFAGDLDDVAAVLNRATLAVAAELGGADLAEALNPTLPVETRSFEAFCHYCRALDAADPKEAREELEGACAIDPWFVEALGELARTALRDQDRSGFEAWAAQLLQAGGLRPLRMIEELIQICDAGFPENALDCALMAARLRPEVRDILTLVAEIGIRHRGEAAQDAAALLSERDDGQDSDDPEHHRLLALRAVLHRLLDQAPRADALEQRALTAAARGGDATLAACRFELGTQALRVEALERAVLHLQAAHALTPDDAVIQGDLAAALLRRGAYAEAARLLLGSEARNVVLQSNLALALRQLGRVPEALEAAQRAVSADASHPQAWAILGDLLRVQGLLDDAARAFERAMTLQPDNLIWRLELGRVLFRLDRFRDAVAHFRVILTQRPELAQVAPELLFVMAEMAQAHGHAEEAETLLVRAWEGDPTVWQAANNLGVLMLQRERFEEAAMWLSRALEIVPDNDGVRVNLTRALDALPHKH